MTQRLESERPASVRVALSVKETVSAAKALEQWPSIPDDILDSWVSELLEIQSKYPRTARRKLDERFQRHYHRVLKWLLKGADPERLVCERVSPSKPLLVALSCMALAIAHYSYDTPTDQFPAELRSSLDLETLEMLSTNILGGPASAATWEVVKSFDAYLSKSAARRPPHLSQDFLQDGRIMAFYLVGGPTQALIEEIVQTEEVPPEAQGIIDAHEVIETYREMGQRYDAGLDVGGFAADLVRASDADDLIDGLRGQWGDIYGFLTAFLWPPSASTAGALLRREPGNCFELVQVSIRRRGWRDDKRTRDWRKRFPVEFDAPLQTDEGSVQRHEIFPGGTEPHLDIEALLERVELTRRERQWASLRAQGYDDKDVRDLLKLSRGRVSQIRKRATEKIRKKMSEE